MLLQLCCCPGPDGLLCLLLIVHCVPSILASQDPAKSNVAFTGQYSEAKNVSSSETENAAFPLRRRYSLCNGARIFLFTWKLCCGLKRVVL